MADHNKKKESSRLTLGAVAAAGVMLPSTDGWRAPVALGSVPGRPATWRW